MKIRYATLLALFVTTLCGKPLHAIDMYVLSGSGLGDSNTTTAFGKIDLTTRVYTQIIAAVSGSNIVSNLTWDPNISAFYVTENTGGSTNLRTLTTSGTLSAPIGTIGKGIYGMTYRPSNNTLYAVENSGLTAGTINTSTGAYTNQSNILLLFSGTFGGRYANLNDDNYLAWNGSNTGRFGRVSNGYTNITTGSNFLNMALAADETTLYGLNGGISPALYTIDTATGAQTLLGFASGSGLGMSIYGAAFAVPVPEPSTYALAAIASGVLAFAARRRRANRS